MIKTFGIGVMVICHLLTGNKVQLEDGTQKDEIKKVLGSITSMHTRKEYIEKVENKEALEYDQLFLVVKEKISGQSYEIKKNACMIVRDESEEEKRNRLYPRKKIEEKVIVKEVVSSSSSEELSDNKKVLNTVTQEANKILERSEQPINKEAVSPQIIQKEEVKVEQKPEVKEESSKKSMMDYLTE